jgi:hypothetical protein
LCSSGRTRFPAAILAHSKGQVQFKRPIRQGQRAQAEHHKTSNSAIAQFAVQRKRPQIQSGNADENKLG